MEPLTQAISRLLEHDPMARFRKEQELRDKQKKLCEQNIRDAAHDMMSEALEVARYPSIARDSLPRLRALLEQIEANVSIIDPVDPLPEDDEQLAAHAKADAADQRAMRREP